MFVYILNAVFRVWLRPNTENKPPDTIWYMNVVPKARASGYKMSA